MESKQKLAYEYIIQRIFNNEYPSHYYIDEGQIASDLNISRTPVHQAVLVLAEEDYVKIFPKRGIIVLPYGYQDVLDLCQMRYLVEPWLIKTYGSYLTEEEIERERKMVEADRQVEVVRRYPNLSMMHHPHSLLIEKCSNSYMKKLLANIEKNANRFPNEREVNKEYGSIDDADQKVSQHMLLLDLLQAGDYEKAAAEMIEHIDRAKEDFCNYWFR